MDEELKQLFLSKGIAQDLVEAIQSNDDSLRTVDDLASGATSEGDAREWAEELGLTGRVPKSRFVQSWLEARARLHMNIQISDQPAVPAASPTPAPVAPVAAPTPQPAPQAKKAWEDQAPAPAPPRSGAFSSASAAAQGGEGTVSSASSMAEPEGPRSILKGGAALGEGQSTLGRRISFSDPVADSEQELGRHASMPAGTKYMMSDKKNSNQELLLISQPKVKEEYVVPRPGQEETFLKPGGFSSELTKLLRVSGLTSLEVRDLEEHADEFRSCRGLAAAVHTEDEAVRLAQRAGVKAKTSKENFAEAWRKCADADDGRRRALSVGSAYDSLALHGPLDFPLFTFMVRGDWDGCSNFLLKGANLSRKDDLSDLLALLLARMAFKEDQALRKAEDFKKKERLSAMLAKTYGEEEAKDFGKQAQVVEAERRWRWTLQSMLSVRTALALQKRLLQEYKAVSFQVHSYELNHQWEAREKKPSLEQKMNDIQALCLDKVLSKVLPSFGFSPDEAGVNDMRACLTKHAKVNVDVRKLQVEISAAVMEGFHI